MKRFYLVMGLWLALVMPAEFILCHVLHIGGGLGRITAGWSGLLFVGATAAYAQWRGLPRLAAPFQITVLSVLLWSSLSIMPLLAARAVYPLADQRLAAIDAAVGLRTSGVVYFVRQMPAADMASRVIYDSTLWLVIAAVLLPSIFGHEDASQRFLVAITISAVLTSVLFCFLPAVGPWTIQGFAPTPSQAGVTAYFERIRSGVPVVIDPAFSGIVSFPSFHCILAILSAYALSCFRWLRWPVWIAAGLICVSTITTGWHYGVDVLGGIAVAYGAILAARYVVSENA